MHLLIISLAALLALSGCQVARYFVYNFADIKDHKKFPARPLERSSAPFTFHATDSGKHPKEVSGIPFEAFLEDNKTVAFMIIQNDTIQYEQYFKSYDASSIVPSFSMAKSVTSLLIGCAIDDGLIGSVNEPVTQYIPELKEQDFDGVSIEHLLQMTAGLDFNESYFNPFGDAASFYYGTKLRKQITRMKLQRSPGEQFEYVSGSTQLLGLVLERALKDRSITDYCQEKLWTPLEMEYDASWSLDRKKDGLEKTFCCLNARARDYAKIGRLMLQKGAWNGQQLVSKGWIERSLKMDTSEGSVSYYQYQWWLPNPGEDFMAQGILGQYIYVHPKKNLIIVRLGKNYGDTNWYNFIPELAEYY